MKGTETAELERSQCINVLLVDDDIADVELARESLEACKLALDLNVVYDGQEAVDYLFKRGKYSTAITPDIILLDLNMPRKGGREVLNEIKQDEILKRIPVVVLTTSDADEDILRSYDLGASCYVKKPVGLTEFEKVVSALEGFWFTVVKFPKR